MKKYFVLLAVLALVFQPTLLLAEEGATAVKTNEAATEAPDTDFDDEFDFGDEDFDLEDEDTLEGEEEVAKPVAKK